MARTPAPEPVDTATELAELNRRASDEGAAATTAEARNAAAGRTPAPAPTE